MIRQEGTRAIKAHEIISCFDIGIDIRIDIRIDISIDISNTGPPMLSRSSCHSTSHRSSQVPRKKS